MAHSARFQADFYPESRFGGFSDIDGTIAFYSRVNALLTRESTVVDYGCGRGAYGEDPVIFRRNLRILSGKVAWVVGLDTDPSAATNPFVDQFFLLNGDCWPLADASVDMVLCDHVLEHLPDPGRFFSEAKRVLKPGGILCVRTPNSWSYVSLVARLVPNRSHAAVLSHVKAGTHEQDVFPTYFRCNSLPALRSVLTRNGFEGVVYGYAAEPSYLSFSKLAYFLGVIHQRIAPGFLRPSLFAFVQKTARD